MKAQIEDLLRIVEGETDYLAEAAALRQARALFRADDGILVPRVYAEHSSRRVLTMELLDGVHLSEFLAGDPPQDLRDPLGAKVCRALARLRCVGRLLHGDPHPGNFLFTARGELGLIDLGCVRRIDRDDWDWYVRMEWAMRGGTDDAAAARCSSRRAPPRCSNPSERNSWRPGGAGWPGRSSITALSTSAPRTSSEKARPPSPECSPGVT